MGDEAVAVDRHAEIMRTLRDAPDEDAVEDALQLACVLSLREGWTVTMCERVQVAGAVRRRTLRGEESSDAE